MILATFAASPLRANDLAGQARLTAASNARRLRFRARLASWNAAEVRDMARLLGRLNAALD